MVKGVSQENYWKLKFLIHTHDLFKAEAEKDAPVLDARNHATLAKEFQNTSQMIAESIEI